MTDNPKGATPAAEIVDRAAVIAKCEREHGTCMEVHSRPRMDACTPENCSSMRAALATPAAAAEIAQPAVPELEYGQEPPEPTALERFNDAGGHEEPDALERLRFFCSLAMRGEDWLDVEPFFDALRATQAQPATHAEVLTDALQKIAAWELPESGRTWDDGSPMSYEAAWGSNGARDYIRGVARAAIATQAAQQQTPQVAPVINALRAAEMAMREHGLVCHGTYKEICAALAQASAQPAAPQPGAQE